MNEVENNCKNCEYELEDIESTHCRRCVIYEEDNFRPKEVRLTKQEIRNKAIDEFVEKLCEYCMKQTNCCNPLECPFCRYGCNVLNIANKMKGE